MWIMLTKKIPTEPSPPRLAIFWSTPWPDDKYSVAQRKKIAAAKRGYVPDFTPPLETENTRYFVDYLGRFEPNWILAREIQYRGCPIRVFPHEFSQQATGNMREFVLSPNPSHELVPSNVASEVLMRDIKSGVRRFIYDAALIDGCNHAQALMTAWGSDITVPNTEFPPLGWYRCLSQYASIICQDWEMAE